MSQVEFLILIPGILIALALAEIIIYLGKAIRNKVKVYWELALLVLVSLDLLFGNWFAFYQRIQFINESYFSFLLINVVPILFFIYTALLIPEGALENDISDGKDHYLGNRKMIWGLLCLYVIGNYVTVTILGEDEFQIVRIIFIPLIGLNVFVDSKILRSSVMIAAVIIKYIQLIAEL